ncbi:ATP-binding domain-containing protein [Nonomuraea sp. NPDC046570]|uniref:HelD family protein n=1 Tax=Nonomuraea sp. NPDC046570 TaxID=3155255 RepID=UPI0033EABFBA
MAEALRTEQAQVTMLYGRLDAARAHAEQALREVHGRGAAVANAQGRLEREVSSAEQSRRLSQLHAVERGLCFGRIDEHGGRTTYIGRIGLRDAGHESVLVDWRAPAARPFYVATPADPGPLLRRRHLHTRERRVVGLDDEVLDLERMSEGDRSTLVGEAALMAALRRGRTGRMGDVVATIQTEQDRVIRSGLAGALVVQGGPGTGKTVAALHRAAYLLYAHRDTLERRGVLVVGPNAMFLRYIGQVLPALGETQVVLATVGELYPGVRASALDGAEAAVVKGDLRMAELVAAAVRDRQRVPGGDLEVEIGGLTAVVAREECARVRDRARAVRLPHNMARKLYVTEMLRALALAEARALEAALRLEEYEVEGWEMRPLGLAADMDEADLAEAARRLWPEPAVRRALDGLWPELTPRRLVGELLTSPERLRAAAGQVAWEGLDWRVLARPEGSPWTVGDVPLLDEAAELLGEDDSARRSAQRAAREERAEAELYAHEVLTVTGLAEEELMAADLLADRHEDTGAELTTADRAAADRAWAYGHVIVDEAQELSQMAWRTVMRRVPARSLTVVGDIAQTGSAAGAASWGEVLDRYVRGRWREERLLVNYRTPVEIMAVAADVLRAVDPGQVPPESVREGGAPPVSVRAGVAELPGLVAGELAEIGEGRLGVITSDVAYGEVAGLFPGGDDLDAEVAVLTVTQSKGLEFDAVVVVDPAGILGQSAKDLYVAVTRATRRLLVVHEGELPALLRNLQCKGAGLAIKIAYPYKD